MPGVFHDPSVPENYIVVGGVRVPFGGQFAAVATKTTTYVATLLDHIILADASGGAFTITLPPAADGKIVLHVKKIDVTANAVTVDGDGAETIDGVLTQILSIPRNSIMIVSDLSNWHVI